MTSSDNHPHLKNTTKHNMAKKWLIFLISIILVTIFLLVLCKQSEKELVVTGYANRNDLVTILINDIPLDLKLGSGGDSKFEILIYRDIIYRSLRSKDKIHVKLDSNFICLIDTVLLLNSNNDLPRVFFENPNETNGKRKVVLIDDAELPQKLGFK